MVLPFKRIYFFRKENLKDGKRLIKKEKTRKTQKQIQKNKQRFAVLNKDKPRNSRALSFLSRLDFQHSFESGLCPRLYPNMATGNRAYVSSNWVTWAQLLERRLAVTRG